MVLSQLDDRLNFPLRRFPVSETFSMSRTRSIRLTMTEYDNDYQDLHQHHINWVSLLNLVHTGYLQFLAIVHNLAGNEHGFLAKTSKTPIDTPK